MDLQELDVIDTEKMYRVYDRWYEIAKNLMNKISQDLISKI